MNKINYHELRMISSRNRNELSIISTINKNSACRNLMKPIRPIINSSSRSVRRSLIWDEATPNLDQNVRFYMNFNRLNKIAIGDSVNEFVNEMNLYGKKK